MRKIHFNDAISIATKWWSLLDLYSNFLSIYLIFYLTQYIFFYYIHYIYVCQYIFSWQWYQSFKLFVSFSHLIPLLLFTHQIEFNSHNFFFLTPLLLLIIYNLWMLIKSFHPRIFSLRDREIKIENSKQKATCIRMKI